MGCWVASFYMEGPTLCWYQWMRRNNFLTSWPAMLQALESRFAPSFYDGPQGALFKLSKRGSVNEYLIKFESLANRIVGLAPPFLLSCFVLGLNPKLQYEVQALKPFSLPQVAILAKLQEDKLLDLHRYSRAQSHLPSPMNLLLSSSAAPTPRFPIKRLSPEEMVVFRDKGLCYHCEEKWVIGHRCKPRLHLFIVNEKNLSHSDPSIAVDASLAALSFDDLPNNPSQLSLNTHSGMLAIEMFCIYGHILHHHVTILVDGKSTHI